MNDELLSHTLLGELLSPYGYFTILALINTDRSINESKSEHHDCTNMTSPLLYYDNNFDHLYYNIINRTYRKLSLEYHPDKSYNNGSNVEIFHVLTRAREVLLNDTMRIIYIQAGGIDINALNQLISKNDKSIIVAANNRRRILLEQQQQQQHKSCFFVSKSSIKKRQRQHQHLHKMNNINYFWDNIMDCIAPNETMIHDDNFGSTTDDNNDDQEIVNTIIQSIYTEYLQIGKRISKYNNTMICGILSVVWSYSS